MSRFLQADTAFATLTAWALIACSRAEPPRASPTTAHEAAATAASPDKTSSAQASPSAVSSPRLPSCVVPLPAQAPKPAMKARTCPPDPSGPLNLARGWVSFPDSPGAPRLSVELADNPTSRERGLMYVEALPEDRGMLFEWREAEPRTFWMHNTCIPLDMMFIGMDGTILGVLEQVPVLNDDPRGIPCPSAQVLEVNAGFTRAHGVQPGHHIRFER